MTALIVDITVGSTLDRISATSFCRESRLSNDWSISAPRITIISEKISSARLMLADENIAIVAISITRLNLDFRPFRLEWARVC
ncbi:hypothetical protein HETIRDRAFT_313126 [Heterobasidion irregulare TC 32-1]|uniref:Uncharacterized protein n=1 Tax=Heterobasidion irregulare (strain TC 32-1) TaxID=747525 RepID=W4KG67_HETIT|nr:uncharacterized protein HETIRDRAFT_313126 [Heterobasidion irregulare TC 32-1]ETW84729.1 hypothetical protein HETIRDRAFT_313126 [Heterobasidion irregulare TC 32-1]